jgi:hypothetical protein
MWLGCVETFPAAHVKGMWMLQMGQVMMLLEKGEGAFEMQSSKNSTGWPSSGTGKLQS